MQDRQYREILRAHGAAILAFVRRLIPQREDAEEVAQDVFVKAFRSLDGFDGSRGTMRGWLLRIAYNEALMFLRRQRPLTAYLEDDERLLRTIGDDEADRLLADVRERRIQTLERAVRQLKPEDQTLLHLYYTDDLPLKEIAQIVGRDAAWLATRLQRIRKRLCITIKTIEDEDE